MIRAYGKVNGSVAAIERLSIFINAEDGVSIDKQVVTVRNSTNGYVYYEGSAAEKITLRIPSGVTYEVIVTEMNGYSPISPIVNTATEKRRTINILYKKIPPAVGDFVYTDGTWSNTYIKDKTCVGICFYANGEDRRMLSLILAETGSDMDGTSGYKYSCCWGDSIIPDGVFNTNNIEVAKTDMNGRLNTDLILSIKQTDNPKFNDPEDYPAANICNNFSYGNKVKGCWWLPSLGELHLISQNFDLTNQNVEIAGGAIHDPSRGVNLWSSTVKQDGSLNVWCMDLYTKRSITFHSGRSNSVLPVTSF